MYVFFCYSAFAKNVLNFVANQKLSEKNKKTKFIESSAVYSFILSQDGPFISWKHFLYQLKSQDSGAKNDKKSITFEFNLNWNRQKRKESSQPHAITKLRQLVFVGLKTLAEAFEAFDFVEYACIGCKPLLCL